MNSNIHQRLRDATRPAHERLEGRLAIHTRLASAAGRRRLAPRYWRLHSEAEQALEPWLGGVRGLEFDARRRTPLLERDLAALGVAPAEAPATLAVGSLAEALGRFYVLEGSTLGGRVIRRQLVAAGHDFTGLDFLDPYGARTGERWRAFLDLLAHLVDGPEAAEAAVAGALAGFRHAELRLCEEAALA